MLISTLIAQASQGGGGFGSILLLWVPIILIFWFFLIRPQSKRMKEHRAMINSVARGDTVVTGGGLVGKVTRVLDTEVEIEIAKDTRVKVVKQTLSEVRNKEGQAAQPAPSKKK